MAIDQKPRHIILKFKKGGRIAEEHVYDSGDRDEESRRAFDLLQFLRMPDKPGSKGTELGPRLIGTGIKGIAPWEDYGAFLKRHGFNPQTNQLEHPQDSLKAERFNFSIPMRVADVAEKPDGTVLVTIEASI